MRNQTDLKLLSIKIWLNPDSPFHVFCVGRNLDTDNYFIFHCNATNELCVAYILGGFNKLHDHASETGTRCCEINAAKCNHGVFTT